MKPAMKKANDEVLAGQAPYRAHERCWPAAVPGIDVDAYAAPVFLYQTPKEVVFIMNNGPEVRHIYLDVPHSKNPKPSWYGESVGHYENGDTLVVHPGRRVSADRGPTETASSVDPGSRRLAIMLNYILDGGLSLAHVKTVYHKYLAALFTPQLEAVPEIKGRAY